MKIPRSFSFAKCPAKAGAALLFSLFLFLVFPLTASAADHVPHILGAYQSGDTVHVYVSDGSFAVGRLISAFYSDDGQLVTMETQDCGELGSWVQQYELQHLSDDSAKVFLVDEDLRPLGAAVPLRRDVTAAKAFCELLSDIIAEFGDAYLDSWNEVAATALTSDLPLTNQLAMICVYEAACVLELGHETSGDWLAVNDHGWENMLNYSDCWPNLMEAAPFYYPTDYYTAAIFFAQGQLSYGDGKLIFDFPWTQATEHFLDGLTLEQAEALAGRFRDSLLCQPRSADPDTADAILREAEQRRAEILNAPTSIVKAAVTVPGETYSGTAYYVSSSTGNDGNDGLTPETAWQTVQHVNLQALSPGDAVFFKRGDVWRGRTLFCREGVTYSAYGEGQKPRFYGSALSGVGADQWSLWYEGENGEKIWKFAHALPDTGGVIFNGGEIWASRVFAYWDVERQLLVSTDDYTTPFTPETALTEDLTCAGMIDFSGLPYPINVYDENRRGDFYLRCDAGNPGALFDEVEFSTTDEQGWIAPVFCASGCTIDNLSVLYFGNCGIQAGPDLDHVTVQNCEVGWGGNRTHCYFPKTEDLPYWMSGDGIYGVCDSGTVSGNYVHHTGGITFESSPGGEKTLVTGPCVVEGNLVEHCAGISLCDPMDFLTVETMKITDNLVLENGFASGFTQLLYVDNGIYVADSLAERCTTLEITGNTVYRSADLHLYVRPVSALTLSDNRFYQ